MYAFFKLHPKDGAVNTATMPLSFSTAGLTKLAQSFGSLVCPWLPGAK